MKWISNMYKILQLLININTMFNIIYFYGFVTLTSLILELKPAKIRMRHLLSLPCRWWGCSLTSPTKSFPRSVAPRPSALRITREEFAEPSGHPSYPQADIHIKVTSRVLCLSLPSLGHLQPFCFPSQCLRHQTLG